MRRHPGSAAFACSRPTALTWGVFDGVHRGHRAVLERLVAEAHARGLEAVGLLFDPHPEEILRGVRMTLLSTASQRARWVEEAGVDHLVLERFTPDLAAMAAKDFLYLIVRQRIRAQLLVFGPDSNFGQAREGSAESARRDGFEVVSVPPVLVDGAPVSSSRIREAVAAGRMPEATRLLGRPLELWGDVVRGSGRGSRIGVPTANLRIEGQMLPALGVYGGEATVCGSTYPAVVNVGRRPTFEKQDTPVVVEAHLLGSPGDILGEVVELRLMERLRDERRFASSDDLVRQIRTDIERWSRSMPIS